ncbi:MAG: tRNA dihydrouridine synthase DusB [Myxococcota bacterium]|nr:tRNA dihydrouridine synthase DusB [Myxococcota bacterium]
MVLPPSMPGAVTIPSFHIDGVQVNPGLVLAPMSGVTDSPFRRLVQQASGDAVGLVMSEFIHVGCLTRKTMFSLIRMAFHPDERPVAIQIYGADPQIVADAARMVQDAGADIVDLNCGCPAPKVVSKGGGAGLLRDLPLMGRIIEAMTAAVDIPVTVKIRNGWCEDSLNALETLHVAESSGARALSVHGRTRLQLYRGEADWDVIRQLKEVANIPVLGSGDICTAADARRRLDATGCDGVLIGRGAITNPWVFRQIVDEMEGRAPYRPTWCERIDLIDAYRDMLVQTYPSKVVPGRLKMMISRLFKASGVFGDVRLACLRAQKPDDILRILRSYFDERGLLDLRNARPEELSEAA